MIERIRERFASVRLRSVIVVVLVAIFSFGLGAISLRACGPHRHAAEDPAAPGAHDATVWTCAMHPQIRRDEPGQCPICGMDLIPVGAAEAEQARPDRITLSERAKALARLRTSVVRRQSGEAAEVRLLGRVEADETTARTVTAWVSGRIDRLHVRVTGERVRAGQTIATLYSPEVLAAHQDLLAANRQTDRMQGASETARSAATAALEAARDRLRLLGVPEATVQEMATASRPTRAIPIRSPFAGTVIERMASEGAYVNTGEPLFRIANLSKVWVQLDAYERDLPSLREGQEVQITVDALPDETFDGTVAFIDPTVDQERRVARVRVEVANPEGRLRPGMFAQGVVRSRARVDAEQPLVIPRTAPLFTGKRSLVYVEVEDAERPTYEARTVRLGPRIGDAYPVVAGLSEGERVVTRGAFVLDADLQIRGGSSMMTRPDDADVGDDPIALPTAERRKLEPVVAAYLELQRTLAADDLAGARRSASSLAGSAAGTELALASNEADAWSSLARALVLGAQRIAHAESLEAARGPFEGLSSRMRVLLRRFGNPLDQPLRTAFCPMAGSQGSAWIQRGEAIDNPYFGEAMRECGEIRETVPPHAHSAPPGESEPRVPMRSHEGHGH